MIPIEQKAPPGDRTAAEWNHVAYATRRRRRILLRRILFYTVYNNRMLAERAFYCVYRK